jgi:hypothetical protein
VLATENTEYTEPADSASFGVFARSVANYFEIGANYFEIGEALAGRQLAGAR